MKTLARDDWQRCTEPPSFCSIQATWPQTIEVTVRSTGNNSNADTRRGNVNGCFRVFLFSLMISILYSSITSANLTFSKFDHSQICQNDQIFRVRFSHVIQNATQGDRFALCSLFTVVALYVIQTKKIVVHLQPIPLEKIESCLSSEKSYTNDKYV